MVISLVILFVAIAISVTWYQSMRRNQAISSSPLVKRESYQFKMENMAVPAGIYFSPTHSWAHLETNGRAKVGVDAFIQGLTGILSEIHVPEGNTRVKQGDPLFDIIHKGNKLVITAPVSGKIKTINTEALQNLRMVHRDPYTFGWLLEMEPDNWEHETRRLYLGQSTASWLKAEIARIRDFFAHSFAPPHAERGVVLLQEGGDIAEGALGFAGKGLWGSFQKLILDPSNQELLHHS
ncbi:MAG: hypothetical protein K9M55_00180 [Candidatus Marinimicrobia bacterium]|nr:hypothetical protein [Candidatus Neomarinimicrobiota bacterium]